MSETEPVAAAAAAAPLAPVDPATLAQPYALHGRCVIAKVLQAGHALIGQNIVVGGWVCSRKHRAYRARPDSSNFADRARFARAAPARVASWPSSS